MRIVLEMRDGIVSCVSNPTDIEVVLCDFDIRDTDNPSYEYGFDAEGKDFMIVHFPSEQSGISAEDKYGRELDKIKPLVQYLDEYIEHEIEKGNIGVLVSDLYAYNSWCELLKQALDAYESTENVKIRIERV